MRLDLSAISETLAAQDIVRA